MTELRKCSEPGEFWNIVREAEQASVADGKAIFFLFIGERSKPLGISWCPDCVAAEPIIYAALAHKVGGCRLIEYSANREEYRNSEYIWRLDPTIQLTSVPTLIKWENAKITGRLGDSDCQVPDKVRNMVEC
mmetsp:Transcript_22313/g.37332  ORF Transcript_22313/g.37332 Transcript_22313/m.37332 type:complete len:132 (+) Transcript_22313:81-476(+)